MGRPQFPTPSGGEGYMHNSDASRREIAGSYLVFIVIARSDLSAVAQRAKAEATKQSILSCAARWIASLALAMTVSCSDPQNALLKNFEPFNPYRQGSSTALVMPIRNPATICGLPARAYSAIGEASSGRPLCSSLMPSASVSLPGPEHSDRSSC